MADSCSRNFSHFAQERIKPVVDTVLAGKRRSLLVSLTVALGVFLVCAAAVYVFLMPYRQMMQTHGVTYWPLIILAPLSLAMVVFCLVFILSLRGAVKTFRTALMARMAEFIHPDLVHDALREMPREEMRAVPLSLLDGIPVAGADQFRGTVDGIAVRFFDLQCAGGEAKKDKNSLVRTGLYFQAAFARQFIAPVAMLPGDSEVSRSGVEAKLAAEGIAAAEGWVRLDDKEHGLQVLTLSGQEDFARQLLPEEAFGCLDALRRQRGAELLLACHGNVLRVVLMAKVERRDLPGRFDGFDFGHCREFCLDATLCLDIARELAVRESVWRKDAAPQA